eukprot:466129_1
MKGVVYYGIHCPSDADSMHSIGVDQHMEYLQKLAIESVFLHLGLAMECEQLFTYGLSYYSAWFIRASVWDCRMYYARFVTVFDGYFETFSSRIYCKLLLLSIG